MLFVTNWLRNSGKMKGYPNDIWTVRIWTVKFPGGVWTTEIWTVKTGLGLPLGLGFLLQLHLGLGLVMTVQFMTVQIKTGNHGTVGWIKMPFGVEVRLGPDHIVLDGNPAPA